MFVALDTILSKDSPISTDGRGVRNLRYPGFSSTHYVANNTFPFETICLPCIRRMPAHNIPRRQPPEILEEKEQ